MSDLYANAKRYDAIFHSTHDLDYWRRLTSDHGKRVLELAAGTGRIAIALAQSGCEVTALEISAGMLEHGKTKSTRAGVHVDFRLGDVRSFAFTEKFDVIILANNSLGHLETLDAALSCFERSRAHLRAGGVLAIDVFVPAQPLLTQESGQKRQLATFTDPADGLETTLSESSRYDASTQIKHIVFHYEKAGQPELREDFCLKMFFPVELDAVLRLAGFRRWEKYGDYQRAPFGPGSARQLVLATA